MSSVHDAVALEKPRVVVLGSGWAAASFMKALPKAIKYVHAMQCAVLCAEVALCLGWL